MICVLLSLILRKLIPKASVFHYKLDLKDPQFVNSFSYHRVHFDESRSGENYYEFHPYFEVLQQDRYLTNASKAELHEIHIHQFQQLVDSYL